MYELDSQIPWRVSHLASPERSELKKNEEETQEMWVRSNGITVVETSVN
jgi:hypothetical protein